MKAHGLALGPAARVSGPPHGMSPFFFGEPDESLFGCWHAPVEHDGRSTGVVLCPPIGQEYIRAHRTFRQLAGRLARQGFHCLRFDWTGCGDSAGDDDAGRVERWRKDAGMAIDVLRDRSGVRTIAMVGLRLGAPLAGLAAAERGDIETLVLWDPVICGHAYLESLVRQHRARMRDFPVLITTPPAGQAPSEALGFPVSEGLRADLEGLDLSTLSRRPARDVLLVETRRAAEIEPLKDPLERLGVRVETALIETPSMWIEDINKVLVPHAVLQAVVAWLDGVAA